LRGQTYSGLEGAERAITVTKEMVLFKQITLEGVLTFDK